MTSDCASTPLYTASAARDFLSSVDGPLHLNYAVMDVVTRSLFTSLCQLYPGQPTADFVLQLEEDLFRRAPGVQLDQAAALARLQSLEVASVGV